MAVAGLLAAVFLLSSRGSTNPGVGQAPTAAPAATEVSAVSNISSPISVSPTANATPIGLFDVSDAGANRGQFNLPRGIAQDAEGNFFVVDTQNFRVQKFDKDGNFILQFGSRGTRDAQFGAMADDSIGAGPSGVEVDKAGNVYVVDTWNHSIEKFSNNGEFLTAWGGYISVADPSSAEDNNKDRRFWGPRGVAVGLADSIYVTDTGNKRILIFDSDGKFLRKIESDVTLDKISSNYPFDKPGELNEPIGIVLDNIGNIYVADTLNNRIQKFDKDGKPAAQWPVPPESWGADQYVEPFLAIDGDGNIYATAPTSHNVLKFNPKGELVGQKEQQGDILLETPTGITVGADGTVYVVDTESHRVVNMGKIP